jgi:hypothetical protein
MSGEPPAQPLCHKDRLDFVTVARATGGKLMTKVFFVDGDTHSIIGAMRDAARFVPELAPLVAPMIGEPAEAEVEIGFGPVAAEGRGQ